MSKPTWSNTSGCSATSAFFVLEISRLGFLCKTARVTRHEHSADQSAHARHVLEFQARAAFRFETRRPFPPLGLLTVAATLPADWQLKLVDLNVCRLTDKDLRWADYVMLSAMIVHKESVAGIVDRCRSFGKPIIAGGPLFTTGHAAFPNIDHFVLGEAEELMPQLVEDMRRGTLRHIYSASSRPEITCVPVPRWDLIDLRHYVTMSVQFSRGCPFDCEFCDIVVMNGRVPRTKSPAQLVAELEQLRLRGWQDMVFIVDDNFIGNKNQAKALLQEIIAWRTRTGTHDGVSDRGLGEPGRRLGTLRAHGAGRFQEGVRGV